MAGVQRTQLPRQTETPKEKRRGMAAKLSLRAATSPAICPVNSAQDGAAPTPTVRAKLRPLALKASIRCQRKPQYTASTRHAELRFGSKTAYSAVKPVSPHPTDLQRCDHSRV